MREREGEGERRREGERERGIEKEREGERVRLKCARVTHGRRKRPKTTKEIGRQNHTKDGLKRLASVLRKA